MKKKKKDIKQNKIKGNDNTQKKDRKKKREAEQEE